MSATDDWCDAISAAADDMLDQHAVGRLTHLPLENRIALAAALLRGPKWGEPYTVVRVPEHVADIGVQYPALVLHYATIGGRDEAMQALIAPLPNHTTKS